MKKLIKLSSSAILIFCLIFSAGFGCIMSAAAGDSIICSVEDGKTYRGSKKNIEVRARNSGGEKIPCEMELNGEKVPVTWDDTDKTSFTLCFTKTGSNTVTVKAGSAEKIYHINYEKASPGEKIGTAVWSAELFTLGGGYLVIPQSMDIHEGENAAQELITLLHKNGYTAFFGGSPASAFYLAYISDGDNKNNDFSGYKNSRTVAGAPANPKKLDIPSDIPAVIDSYLKKNMSFYDKYDYENSWEGYIGEFVFSNGSGWMYSVNNSFPNVGFSDCYLSDGDTVRVQFTLCYGADIGGSDALGGASAPSFIAAANKDYLTVLLSRGYAAGISGNSVFQQALNTAVKPDAAYQDVKACETVLYNLLYPDVRNSDEKDNASSDSGSAENHSQSDNASSHCAAEPDIKATAGSSDDSTYATEKISETTVAPVTADDTMISEKTEEETTGEVLTTAEDIANEQTDSGKKKSTVYIYTAVSAAGAAAVTAGIIIYIKKKRKTEEISNG